MRGSQSPKLHDLVNSIRTALPVAALGLCAFALLVPVSTVAIPERSVFNVNYTHDQIKFRFFDENLGLALCLVAVLLGMALALVLFAFLRDRKFTASLLSCGIPRWRLFFHRWLAGALALILSVAIPFAVSLALNVSALDWHPGELRELLFTASGYCVTGLVAFSATALAATCAGTLFEAVVFAAALLGSVSVVAFGMQSLFEHLLVGNAAGELPYGLSEPVAPSLLSVSEPLNPALFFLSAGEAHQSFTVRFPVMEPVAASWSLQLIWLAIALIVSALGAIMLVKRHGEQAQMAGMCVPLSFITAALAGFGAFAAVFQAIATADTLVALVAAAVIFAAISIWLLRWPLRGRSSRSRSLVVLGGELVLLAACVAVVATGGAGFSTWVPEVAEIVKVELSYVGTPSYLGVPYTGTASNSAYYLHTNYVFDVEKDELAAVAAREVHQLLVDEASLPLAPVDGDFADTVVPHDVVLRYTLAGGSEVVRYFDRARVATLERLLVLDDSTRVRELQTAVITGDVSALSEADAQALRSSQAALAYQTGSVFLSDANYNLIQPVVMNDAGRAALLQALAFDVATQETDQRYYQSEQVFGTLLFTNSPATDMTNMGFSFSSAVVPLSPDFKQTRQWLKNAGLLDQASEFNDSDGVNPALIEEMTFMPDSPYASVVARQGGGVPAPSSRFFIASRSELPGRFWAVSDFGSLKSTSDASKIAELAPHLRSACFMAGGYFVQAKLRGIEAYVYYYLPESEAPAFVKSGGM